jgi:transposase-like protein
VKFISWKDRKVVCAGIKRIYTSATVDEAQRELEEFGAAWDEKYPAISQSWRRHWPNLITLFDYPPEIRKVIYTTNAIESLNSVIRKAIKIRRLYPSDDAALKVVYLTVQAASKKWTMPVRDWKKALNRFTIDFGDRLPAN